MCQGRACRLVAESCSCRHAYLCKRMQSLAISKLASRVQEHTFLFVILASTCSEATG
jgi:hypothetical protein